MPHTVDQSRLFRAPSIDLLEEKMHEILAARPQAIPVITGPTATGKSSLAMRLATKIGGEIVNGDAMQIYRGFDIGSAKASQEDRRQIVHHMIDIKDACDSYSVARFIEEVEPVLDELIEQKRKPIICGGSVQYISALLDGLVFPDIEPDLELRQHIVHEVMERGLQNSWELINTLDPEAASAIAPVDKRRITRFLELYRQTGMTKTELNELSRAKGPSFDFVAFWLDRYPRQALYQRINDRVDTMYEQGLLDETRALMKQYNHYSDCPAFRGIGYREAVAHLEGRISEQEARELTARSTRRYAKRQQTWLRRRDDLFVLLLDRF